MTTTKINRIIHALIYLTLISILRRSAIPFLIIFSYIILLLPAIYLLFNTVMNDDTYNVKFIEEKQDVEITDKPPMTVAALVFGILMELACFAWIFGLTWYVFTRKIHLM